MKEINKDISTTSVSKCFSDDELFEYKFKTPDPELRKKIHYHLIIEKCEYCCIAYDLLEEEVLDFELHEVVTDPAIVEGFSKLFNSADNTIIPIRIEIGQIWVTSTKIKGKDGLVIDSVEESLLVLIVDPGNGRKRPDNILRVLPVSFNTEFHVSGESHIVDYSESFPVLLEVFNEQPMLAGNLELFRYRIPENDMDEVERLRKSFDSVSDKDDMQSDHTYQLWKEKEIKLAEHLSQPVTNSTNEKEVVIYPFKKAAADKQHEIRRTRIADMGDFTLGVIQKNADFILRMDSDDTRPDVVTVNGNEMEIKTDHTGLFDVFLGTVDQVQDTLEITVIVDSETFQYTLSLNKEGR